MPEQTSLQEIPRRASRLYASGDAAGARQLLEPYLDQQPRDAQAHYLMGLTLAASGDPVAACDSLARAASLAPEIPSYHGVLGNLLLQLGEHKAAVERYKSGLLYAPNSAELHMALAGAYMAAEDWYRAETALRETLRHRGEYVEAHYNLGIVLSELGRSEEAEQVYRAVIALNPDFYQAWNNLGNLLSLRGRVQDALNCYRELTQRVPRFARGFCNLGMALERLGQVEEAEQAYRHALTLGADVPDAFESLAFLCESLNRLDEAQALATRGLANNPHWRGLNIVAGACARRRGDYSLALEHLNAAARVASDDFEARLRHEQARCHEALGQYGEAFENYTRAQAYQAREAEREGVRAATYSSKLTRLQTFMKSGASLADPEARAPRGEARARVVFLVGFPRSGTTLLDQILDVHPELLVVEEQPMLAAAETRLSDLGKRYPGDLPQLSAVEIDTLRAAYLKTLNEYVTPGSGETVVDKFPLNAVEVPLIETLFPNGKYLFALRHPCDVVFSCFSVLLKANDAMASFHSLTDAARLYTRVMDLWLASVERYALDVHTVRYENLVEDFDATVAGVLKFLDVAWDDKVRDYRQHAMARGQINTPSYEQVVKPIYKHSIGRWRNYGSAFDEVLPLLMPYIERFGYQI